MSDTSSQKPSEPGTLNYIDSMLDSLHTMALSDERRFLAYLIDLAHLQAAEELEGERQKPSYPE